MLIKPSQRVRGRRWLGWTLGLGVLTVGAGSAIELVTDYQHRYEAERIEACFRALNATSSQRQAEKLVVDYGQVSEAAFEACDIMTPSMTQDLSVNHRSEYEIEGLATGIEIHFPAAQMTSRSEGLRRDGHNFEPLFVLGGGIAVLACGGVSVLALGTNSD